MVQLPKFRQLKQLQLHLLYHLILAIQSAWKVTYSETQFFLNKLQYINLSFLTHTFKGPCKGDMGSFMSLTPSGGTIRSPNYPNTYANDDDCDFIISIDGGARKRIAVTFVTHTLELYYDVLRVS